MIKAAFKLDWRGKQVGKAIHDEARKAVNYGAQMVLKTAESSCPVETAERSWGSKASQRRVPGALRDSGRIKEWDKRGVVGAYIVFGGKRVMSHGVDTYYGRFVELGTPGTTYRSGKRKGKARIAIKANPFLRKALRRNRRKIKALFEFASR